MRLFKPIVPVLLPVILIGNIAKAQFVSPPATATGNYFINHGGNGLMVNAPISIAGPVSYSFAATSSPSWGGALTAPYNNVQVVKPADSTGCSTLSSLSGKFALVFRGNCEFGVKALNAQNAGAAGVIVVNNAPGVIDMGPGVAGGSVTIPVVMIGQQDGNMINAVLNNSQTVTIAFTPWQTGFTNDIGIIPGGVPQWHASVIPKTLLSAAAPHKGVTAGYLASYGTATLTNIKLKSVVSFTPTGGSATQVYTDSATKASFAPGDSVAMLVSSKNYDVTAPSTGRYDVTYTASTAQTDNNPVNNAVTTSFYISDSVYCKSRYDMTANRPLSNAGYRFTSFSTLLSGPLFYMGKGRHMAKRVHFTVNNGNPGVDLSGNTPVSVFLLKWDDGVVQADSIIQGGELTMHATGYKVFTSADTNYMHFTAELEDMVDPTHYPVMDSGWYWVALEVESDLFLGVDGDVKNDYFTRSFARANQQANSYKEYYAPTFAGNMSSLGFSSSPGMFPFEGSNDFNTVSFTNQKRSFVPAVSLDVLPVLDVKDSTVRNCIGDHKGQIIITPQSGTAPYQYKLGNGSYQASNIFTNLAGGTYNVTIRDAGNRLAYVSVTVDSVSKPVADAGNPVAITEGQSVTIGGNPTGAGNAPLTYAWLPATGLDNASITNPVASPLVTTKYYVTVTDVNNCTGTDSVTIVVFPLGIDSASSHTELSVYPNPTHDIFTITGGRLEDGLYELELKDLAGRTVSAERCQVSDHRIRKQVSLSGYADGVYLLTLQHGKHQAVIRVQKTGVK